MKISLNWLKDFIDISHTPEEITAMLTALGIETSIEKTGQSFSGVVLGKVLECGPHENADKLSVCKVDTGDNKNYTIVCGAPNVKSGLHVPVAKVGATLQNGEFTIKQAKLRGVKSNGMICSGRELAINDDHEGILILDTNEKLGTPIEDIISFNKDIIFELDLTPNRGDCLSHIGIARELAIVVDKRVNLRRVKLMEGAELIENYVKVHINDIEACPRYATRVIKGIHVGPSPKWLVERLISVGLSSINNIVDAANYALFHYGHPMHTFDLNKISENEINVRYAKDGEQFITLDGEKRKLKDFHLLICDKNKPVALAGIMGGINSGITDNTTEILLESAYFDPTVIRKGAKVLDLSTEASRRFERGTDIEGIIPAIDQLAQLILEVAGGEVLKGIVDFYPQPKESRIIKFSISKCESLLGIAISERELQSIFKSLQITYTKKDGLLECSIPSFRNDLEREVDLCEEVARVIGYDNIPSSDQFSASYTSFIADAQQLDALIRTNLHANGFNEHYSNSLQNENHTLNFVGGEAIQLINPLSQDMAYMRNSIIPGLLMAASYNEKRQSKGFKLFEIGALHNQSKKSITGSSEKYHLGLLWYGEPDLHWRKFEERDIFRFKGELTNILQTVGLSNISFKAGKISEHKISLKIHLGKTTIGNIGIPKDRLLKQYNLNVAPVVCDLKLHIMRELWQNRKTSYKAPVPFPSMIRDIALQVSREIPAEDLLHTIRQEGGNTLIHVSLFDVYQSEEVGDKNKSLAFSLKFQSVADTLTDLEVDQDVEKILQSLNKVYGANQR